MRALVVDGGGMRGAFTAGFLAGLKSFGIDYKFFDCYFGSSAGACTMTYFLTDQVEEGIRIWQDYLPNGFMAWRGLKPYNDLQYLESVFRKLEPLDCKTLRSRRQKGFAVLSSTKTLKEECVCLNKAVDPIKVLMASVAIPLFSSSISMDGIQYYDGGLTSAIPIKNADLLKPKEIWVVSTQPPGYRRKALFWKIASWFAVHDTQVKKLLVNRALIENKILEEIEKRSDIVLIRPEKHLPVNWRNSNRSLIKKSIRIGEDAARRIITTRDF